MTTSGRAYPPSEPSGFRLIMIVAPRVLATGITKLMWPFTTLPTPRDSGDLIRSTARPISTVHPSQSVKVSASVVAVVGDVGVGFSETLCIGDGESDGDELGNVDVLHAPTPNESRTNRTVFAEVRILAQYAYPSE